MTASAIDLVAAAEGLPREQSRLRHETLQLRDIHSVRTDLSLAYDFAVTMRAIRASAHEEEAGGHSENSFLALFYSALLLYVRATKTQHDNRRSFDLWKHYDDAELEQHGVLCDLRDMALAHYGEGGRYTGPPFQKDGVFVAQASGADGTVMTASRRLVIAPELIASLHRMTHRSLILADKRLQEQNTLVTEMLNAAIEGSPELLAHFQAHIIDFDDWIGDAQASAEIMGGPRVGYQRGTSRHT